MSLNTRLAFYGLPGGATMIGFGLHLPSRGLGGQLLLSGSLITVSCLLWLAGWLLGSLWRKRSGGQDAGASGPRRL